MTLHDSRFDSPTSDEQVVKPSRPAGNAVIEREGAWALPTNQSSKLIMHSGGKVEGYLGDGTVTLRDANARRFDLQFPKYSGYNFYSHAG